MIPVDKLHASLTVTDRDLLHMGATTWRRFLEWEKPTQPARDSLRGGGFGEGKTDTRLEDEHDDRQASRYHHELHELTERIDRDLARLRTLLRIANPDRPRSLRPGDLTTTQLIADGWCPSCFRNDQHLNPVAEGRYRDRCRACGEHRAATGTDPSLDDLKTMHTRGKRTRQRIA